MQTAQRNKRPAQEENSAGRPARRARLRLFGTDGIRGRANRFPVTPGVALKVGQALGLLLREKREAAQAEEAARGAADAPERLTVLIGKDTRLSGYMLEQALAAGLNSMGVQVQLTGPLPTPGIGFLAQNMRAAAGAVISASHNPYYDNGIKLFSDDGFKIPSADERRIEDWVFEKDLDELTASLPGRTRRITDAAGRYIVFAKSCFPLKKSLKGLTLVLDCANGAAYKTAPAVFEELGAKVLSKAARPDGFNINKDCGALFPGKISEAVLKHQADIGISLDGDGDRVILSDEKGRILNGDHILGICALRLKAEGKLPAAAVAATHFSNSGLESSLKSHGISLVRTETGDRYVVELMRKRGIVLGGEPSGHIVFLNQSTTGDGSVAALNVLGAMRAQNKKLSELRDSIREEPQTQFALPLPDEIQKNESGADGPDLTKIKGFESMIASIKKRLGEGARVHLRFSGTEPVLRGMVEGRTEKEAVSNEALRLKNFLSKNLKR